jgi:tRNA dimethylallyltransferase
MCRHPSLFGSRWLDDARQALAEAWGQGRVAIVVGGTGLYFRSLEQGLSDVPHVPAEIRARWRRALAERGSERGAA